MFFFSSFSFCFSLLPYLAFLCVSSGLGLVGISIGWIWARKGGLGWGGGVYFFSPLRLHDMHCDGVGLS